MATGATVYSGRKRAILVARAVAAIRRDLSYTAVKAVKGRPKNIYVSGRALRAAGAIEEAIAAIERHKNLSDCNKEAGLSAV